MSDLFDESFMEQLVSDPLDALRTIITRYTTSLSNKSAKEQFELSVQAYALVREYSSAYAPQFKPQLTPDLVPADKQKSIQLVASSFKQILTLIETEKTSQSLENFEQRAKALVKKVDAIEFTDGDINRLQELINEMRDIATETTELGERHRRRILARLEKLQAEIHKRVTKLDQAWLLMPEIGLALGQFGKNAAPMWDRLNETLRIVAGAEARRAELPSSYKPPFLPAPDLDENLGDDDPQESGSKPPN